MVGDTLLTATGRNSCRQPAEVVDSAHSVIRDYLGHASVATTSRYITTNLQMKRDVLEAFWRRAGLTSTRTTAWRPTSNVLSFLASL